ncbi:MAG: hypothetical protein A3I77_04315 [Gammaproteobacteria bacterium RIFCSPLOWO2_02_FULL_42_14]|nr:MAG: hypothetical protein A3B71_05615 [Gammaproteobacteria bacterium RIFCSPHIGHO2_02_FULL_42_43]OGT28431.1 MAG: hypothetical protein A2624_01120 [Gammaproteobacteria bacterium RIFCSPHIGHO2_01_FULL_42_8]OGT51470.1 MAG: hypothetical protein A3E54_05380 [Gammaproteobacteria bacterium RIFCSPHIGHO2_12_FULL_41_25]OGT62171.1 MAG: hypothetical protein A3I77_04315 [Gammaproteobacteria bacterium RIFCSPLOWO2_02_FULL_42_14]OGT85844.1 MAG: hypothetical protein A3G86_04005 [Gammaproteobacteria bacterium R
MIKLTEKIVTRFLFEYHKNKIYWHPRLLYRRKNSIRIHKPIFMLGVQGGGLTVMSRIVRLLPQIVYISGNCSFWAGKDELHNSARFKHMPDALTLRSPGYYNLLGHEKNHPDFGYERAFLYASNEFLHEYRLTESDWTPELDYAIKNAVRVCLRTYAKNLNNAQFIDMSQSYILKIPFLKKCFPDARFVIVTRDPYAVCWKQAQVSLIFQKNPKRAVQLAAEHWFNSYKIALNDTKNMDHVLWLQFEDFMQKPMPVMKKLFSFLDQSNVDIEKLIAQHSSTPLGSCDPEKWFPIKTSVNQRHYHTLPEWAKSIIQSQCDPLIKEFGHAFLF